MLLNIYRRPASDHQAAARSPALSGHGFNDAHLRTCWRHFVEAEIGLAQETIVLFGLLIGASSFDLKNYSQTSDVNGVCKETMT